MTWQVEYETSLGIIEAVYAGHVTAADFKHGTVRAIELAKKHRTKLLLIDNSQLESAVTKMEIYEMPRYYDQIKADRRSRMSIILPQAGKTRDDVLFYETVCRNRGWSARVFAHRREAIDWLLGTSADG